jgi:hypothetical protein
MPEATSNVEFAHKIHEQAHREGGAGGGGGERRTEWIEILEAIVLAFVAVATAWSGYQAARWDARSAQSYALASATNVRAQEEATLAGQDRLYDIVTFNGWIAAAAAGNTHLASIFERRFRPEYEVAFDAWIKLDPLHNDSAPAGPIFMPEYKSALAAQSAALSQQAGADFTDGVKTRETGDQYVRLTVFLATVLLLTALSQRFKILGPRVGILAVAGVMLVICSYWIATFPKA